MRRPLTVITLLAAVVATLVLGQPGSPASAVSHRPAAGPAGKPATELVEVRPVTAAGKPAAGWSVTRESGTVDCDGSSLSAVDDGIVSCYPTAYALRACWKSARHTVLCVRDAQSSELVRVRYSGTYPQVEAPVAPTPMNLTLADGRTCLSRVGGAWGAPAQHPQWIGFDSCSRNASVYGPGSTQDGINRSQPTWTVRLWSTGVDPDGDHLVKRAVTTGYLVGTAA